LIKRGLHGGTQSKNIESPDKPAADYQHETFRFEHDRMFKLREQGSASQSLPEMWFLPG
jgi:hypothetical protein